MTQFVKSGHSLFFSFLTALSIAFIWLSLQYFLFSCTLPCHLCSPSLASISSWTQTLTSKSNCTSLTIQETKLVNNAAFNRPVPFLLTILATLRVQERSLSSVKCVTLFLGQSFLVFLSRSSCLFYKLPLRTSTCKRFSALFANLTLM